MSRPHKRPSPPVTESAGSHLSDQTGAHAVHDSTLVAKAITGDRAAVEQLLVDAQELAWRFSMTVCGHPQDAEDAMQEALVRTYTHVPQLRDPEAFRPWLYRTVRNACLMSRRRRVDEPSRMLSLDELLPVPGATPPADTRPRARTPEEVVVNVRLRRRLNAALGKLPAAFRAVVFLREMEGLTTRETAETLGMSEDNVKTRLHRARLFLQKELGTWRAPAPPARADDARAVRPRKGSRR
jgi:RNA polymerase sigma-70 factor, ECF subfamily